MTPCVTPSMTRRTYCLPIEACTWSARSYFTCAGDKIQRSPLLANSSNILERLLDHPPYIYRHICIWKRCIHQIPCFQAYFPPGRKPTINPQRKERKQNHPEAPLRRQRETAGRTNASHRSAYRSNGRCFLKHLCHRSRVVHGPSSQQILIIVARDEATIRLLRSDLQRLPAVAQLLGVGSMKSMCARPPSGMAA